MTRKEKKALRSFLAQARPTLHELAELRHRTFQRAKGHLADASPEEIIEWLEDVIGALSPTAKARAGVAEALTSPGDAIRNRIIQLLRGAKQQIDICVFTITDNRLSDEILAAHRRGVAVRIISDNDKADDRGSDVDRLDDKGVPVREDRTEHHMHHKYALFDRRILLTGSYNWTRSASAFNQENVVIVDEDRLVRFFERHFESEWTRLA